MIGFIIKKDSRYYDFREWRVVRTQAMTLN